MYTRREVQRNHDHFVHEEASIQPGPARSRRILARASAGGGDEVVISPAVKGYDEFIAAFVNPLVATSKVLGGEKKEGERKQNKQLTNGWRKEKSI